MNWWRDNLWQDQSIKISFVWNIQKTPSSEKEDSGFKFLNDKRMLDLSIEKN